MEQKKRDSKERKGDIDVCVIVMAAGVIDFHCVYLGRWLPLSGWGGGYSQCQAYQVSSKTLAAEKDYFNEKMKKIRRGGDYEKEKNGMKRKGRDIDIYVRVVG